MAYQPSSVAVKILRGAVFANLSAATLLASFIHLNPPLSPTILPIAVILFYSSVAIVLTCPAVVFITVVAFFRRIRYLDIIAYMSIEWILFCIEVWGLLLPMVQ